jgi:hypothetical protein
MDARTRNHRDFNSAVVICKEKGLEYLWQSRKWVFSHAEIRGKDNKKNIESDSSPSVEGGPGTVFDHVPVKQSKS